MPIPRARPGRRTGSRGGPRRPLLSSGQVQSGQLKASRPLSRQPLTAAGCPREKTWPVRRSHGQEREAGPGARPPF